MQTSQNPHPSTAKSTKIDEVVNNPELIKSCQNLITSSNNYNNPIKTSKGASKMLINLDLNKIDPTVSIFDQLKTSRDLTKVNLNNLDSNNGNNGNNNGSSNQNNPNSASNQNKTSEQEVKSEKKDKTNEPLKTEPQVQQPQQATQAKITGKAFGGKAKGGASKNLINLDFGKVDLSKK